jgi:hypothetical protein
MLAEERCFCVRIDPSVIRPASLLQRTTGRKRHLQHGHVFNNELALLWPLTCDFSQPGSQGSSVGFRVVDAIFTMQICMICI